MKNTLLMLCLLSVGTCATAATLSDKHKTFGLTDQPAQSQCLGCHGSYEALAEKSKENTPNPHANHMGKVQCDACHSWKGKSYLICNDCHSFPKLQENLSKHP